MNVIDFENEIILNMNRVRLKLNSIAIGSQDKPTVKTIVSTLFNSSVIQFKYICEKEKQQILTVRVDDFVKLIS